MKGADVIFLIRAESLCGNAFSMTDWTAPISWR
jgi:hypothetical protein